MTSSTQYQSNEDILKAIDLLEEKPELDYKESINLEGDRKAKAELTKDIIAMANSGGGILIGGVKETSTGFEKIGMSNEDLNSFDSTKLNQFVNNYCDPPINSTTRVIHADGKSFGVIIVPEFNEQPHIVTKNYSEVLCEGDLLVRSPNNESKRARPNELRDLLTRGFSRHQGLLQKMLQSVIPSSRPQFLESAKQVDVTIPFDVQNALERYKGFRIIRLMPIGEFHIIRLPNLASNVTRSAIKEKNSGYPSFPRTLPREANETRLPIGILIQGENIEFKYMGASFFGVNGLVFCASSLWEDEPRVSHPEGSLGIFSCIRLVFESLLFLVQYYKNLDYQGAVKFEFSVESSIERTLVLDSQNYWPFFHNYTNPMSIPVSIARVVNTNINLQELEDLTVEIIRDFFWFFTYDVEVADIQRKLNYIKEHYTAIPNFTNMDVLH